MSNNVELQTTNNNKPRYGGTFDEMANGSNAPKKLKYPKSVFFIISNEFCERFSYYGMRTILSLYLQNKLKYSETDSTVIYHTFVMLCYFFPLFGAIIADSCLGKFKTILYLSIVYAIGCITLSASSSGYWIFSQSEAVFSLAGLLLIAIGTGGIKPCVSSFGGDQFVLPEQEKQLQQFFSVFYFSINAGSLISTFLTPDLREDVKCLGQDTCYPLAFGVPAVLMVVSIIVFALGRCMYKVKKPSGNIIVDVTKCTVHAISRKIKSKEKRDHWLDYAKDKYSNRLVEDTKVVMSLIVLFSPTIFFWSLYEQQGTSWIFQAERMNGQLGNFVIKPDQMQVVNPVLILALIPVFEMIVYPILYKLHLVRTSIQKLIVGGLLASVAFLVAAGVEYKLEPTYEILPQSGLAQLRLINGFNCPASVVFNHDKQAYSQDIVNNGIWQIHSLKCVDNETVDLSITIHKISCPSLDSDLVFKNNINISEKKSVSWLFYNTPNDPKKLIIVKLEDSDTIQKSHNGNPQIRVAYKVPKDESLELVANDQNMKFTLLQNGHVTNTTNIEPRTYQIKLAGKVIVEKKRLEFGGVYTLLIMSQSDHLGINVFEISPPNTVHILWQIPQISILTISEIMFSITGLEFSYSQAPKSMKSVISSLWLLTDSIGNLFVVLISGIFEKQTRIVQFLIYACLMVLVMFVFAIIARTYRYVDSQEEDDEEEGHDNPAFSQ